MYVDSSQGSDPASGPGVVQIVAGDGITVDSSDPSSPRISSAGGSSGVESVVAGARITVDNTDPANPVVAADAAVVGITAGAAIIVDSTDPAHPDVSVDGSNVFARAISNGLTIGIDAASSDNGSTVGGPLIFTPQAEPSTTEEGMLYYDSTTHNLRLWNGTTFVDVTPAS